MICRFADAKLVESDANDYKETENGHRWKTTKITIKL